MEMRFGGTEKEEEARTIAAGASLAENTLYTFCLRLFEGLLWSNSNREQNGIAFVKDPISASEDLDTKKRTVADQLSDERKNMRALQLQVLRSLKPKQTMKIDKFFEALDDYAVHDAELLDRMREVNPCILLYFRVIFCFQYCFKCFLKGWLRRNASSKKCSLFFTPFWKPVKGNPY